MRRVKIYMTATALLVLTASAAAQEKISREDYINTYAELAMKEMIRTGVPASITLAQGCLESDNGNSRLATNGKNHFGIKCHDWTGRRIHHDDDERNECFRRYRTVQESYIDHSDFLVTKSRYAELFLLKQDDYKGWARGLKKAGYATSRQYADLLITIIEENALHEYDNMVLTGQFGPGVSTGPQLPGETRNILTNNRIEYIITQHGDSPSSLREELDLYPHEIYRYNNLDRGATLDSGMIIYLQPKRCRAEKGNEIHVVQENQTMWDISQIYGVRINRLYRINDMEYGSQPEKGTEIWLRRRKPADAGLRSPEPAPETEEEAPEMEFEFDG